VDPRIRENLRSSEELLVQFARFFTPSGGAANVDLTVFRDLWVLLGEFLEEDLGE
jgi:hypothetical protein